MQHDHHLIPWLKARFGITITQSLFGVTERRFHVYEGETTYAGEPTIIGAAVEYAACYDGALFDRLTQIEVGE